VFPTLGRALRLNREPKGNAALSKVCGGLGHAFLGLVRRVRTDDAAAVVMDGENDVACFRRRHGKAMIENLHACLWQVVLASCLRRE
jgi:hypothetical protein